MRSIFTLFFVSAFVLTAWTQRDPFNMTLLGSYDDDSLPTRRAINFNDIWGYTDCDGHEYGIIGSLQQVHFIDLDDPNGPSEIARIPGGGSNIWRDIKTYRDRAYSVSDFTQEGLMIFDLSQLPDTVVKTYQSTEFFTRAHNIYIDEANGRLYVAGSDSADYIILDLTGDPDNPTLLGKGSLPGGGYYHDIYVRDNIGYCSQERRGYWIWDFTDPLNPVFKASVPTLGYNHSSWVTEDGNYAIYAEEVPTGLPLGVVDLRELDQGNLEVINTFKFPLEAAVDSNSRPHNPFIRDHYAIVSYYQDGVQIFDIEDPLNPKPVAYYDTYENTDYPNNVFGGTWGAYPYLPSGRIIISDVNKGLLVLRADSIQWDTIIATTLPEPEITFSQMADTFCLGDTIQLTGSDGAMEYNWVLDNDALYASGQTTSVYQSGNYTVDMTNGHCFASTDVDVVFKELAAPVIQNDMEMLFTFVSGVTYQWYRNDSLIVGASSVAYTATESGDYHLVITDPNGCTARSNTIEIEILVNTEELASSQIKAYPNPVNEQLFVKIDTEEIIEKISLTDMTGRLLSEQTKVQNSTSFDLKNLPAAVYFLNIQTNTAQWTQKIIKR